MQAGAFAKKYAVTQRALRLYEEKGLLPAPERTASGDRNYIEEVHGKWLEQILILKQMGYTLMEIKGLLPKNGSGEIGTLLLPEEKVDTQIAFLEKDKAYKEIGLKLLRDMKAKYGGN